MNSRLNIIFIAFLFSSLVYLMVGFALTKSGWSPILPDQGSNSQVLFAVFLSISVAVLVLMFQIKSRLLPAGEDTTNKAIFSKSILLFALAEVPSILGLVLFLLTGKLSDLIVLCIVSIAAFLLVKPRN